MSKIFRDDCRRIGKLTIECVHARHNANANNQPRKATAMATIDTDAIAVTHDGSKLEQWSVAAQFAVNGLDGFRGKMTAACQRALLGAVPFGRKTVSIDCSGNGIVRLLWRTSCGTDTLFIDMTFTELAERISPPENAKLINIL